MRFAAYQAPLDPVSVGDALALGREQVVRCETREAEFLCFPEGFLGGLADYADNPEDIALSAEDGQLQRTLAPLASDTVTTIVGFTEIDGRGSLFNSAAVLYRGAVVGVYRKLHPAIHRSVYHPGRETPVFAVEALTFGILICRDSAYPELGRAMALQGATVLFVPTNNGMPPSKGGHELVGEARRCDATCARDNGVAVIRADVSGMGPALVSYGSSGIVSPGGAILGEARQLESELLVADIDPS